MKMYSIKEIDFKKLIAKEKNGRMRTRLLALAHIKDGANNTQAANYLKSADVPLMTGLSALIMAALTH